MGAVTTPSLLALVRIGRVAFRPWLVRVCIGLHIACLAGWPLAASAHPEDDFCDDAMMVGTELCQQLAALNRETAGFTPLLDESGNAMSPLEAGTYFTRIGVEHILPGGLDHILFVLVLFLTARSGRDLVLQISVFTVAHTLTLGLTAAGVIALPADVVEPLIALSIAVVALEAFVKIERVSWKYLIVFGFGLFHGMGFAGFIGEIGLPPDQFWPALIGFNVGVEIGQLSVVILAALLSLPLRRALGGGATARLGYRRAVVIPACLGIAAIGLWWFVSRALGL